MHCVSTILGLAACLGIAHSSPAHIHAQVALSEPATLTQSATTVSLPSNTANEQILLPQNSVPSFDDIAKWNEVTEVQSKNPSLEEVDTWNDDSSFDSIDSYTANLQGAINDAAGLRKDRINKRPLPVFRFLNQDGTKKGKDLEEQR